VKHHGHTDYIDVVSAQGPAKLSGKMTTIFVLMMIVGFGAFAFQAFVQESRIGWIALLHNFYFFTGLSAAGVVIAAVLPVTNAMWGRPLKRFTEASGAFLPWSLLFLVVLYFGAEHLYEWAETRPDPEFYPSKHWWLQTDFVFARQFVFLLILSILAHRFVSISVRPDMGLAHEKNPELWPQPSGWRGSEEETAIAVKKQGWWGVCYCLFYAVIISMFAYDMIMSLDYRWFSTMFGGWNFTTFMLLGFGSLYFITHFMSQRFGLEKYMHRLMYHDLGKLTFGFTVVWGYLFFAQLMVIWYGNLAHETGYLITRFKTAPWQAISWTVFAMVFLLPFLIGLSKKIKMSPATFAPIVLISFVGIWLERFVLIAPATWYFDRHAGQYQDGLGTLLIFDALVFVGFLGLFALVYARFLYRRPRMVISDPKLELGVNRH